MGGNRKQASYGGLGLVAMGRGTLVPDAEEAVLDQLVVEGRSWLVMVLRPAGEESVCPECRRTCRLSAALEQISLVLGGSAGSRLTEQLGRYD
jgi:hypothetical protein